MRLFQTGLIQAGRFVILVVVSNVILAACSYPWSAVSSRAPTPLITSEPGHITATPFLPSPPTRPENASPTLALTATESPTAVPAVGASSPASSVIWAAPYLPPALRQALILPEEFGSAGEPQAAALRLEVGDQMPVARWVYALVAPFPTTIDGVSFRDLRRCWEGECHGPFAGHPLLLDESTYGVYSALWGQPAERAVKMLPSDELLAYAWEHRPAWAIVPFEVLEPRWKVLEVDRQSPLRKEFDLDDYPLVVTFSLNGQGSLAEGLLNLNLGRDRANLGLPSTNFDPGRLTTLAMTGVTALVRATAFTMRRNGVLYPARDIGALLRAADITHISNEIPFEAQCPPPNPTQEDLRFCSHPSYIALLEEVGTDVVELTGDHFADWGPEAMRFTLDLYAGEDWVYYGGGYDREDARRPREVEHNGNRLAFIGCNAKGGGYATASESNPGAVACDYDWMQAEIQRLVEAGEIVIATFQHFEYYTYSPQPDQIEDFRAVAGAGASIVSGSQAHQPQGMEFFQGAFIHYGLGNLFFDQYNYCTDLACNDAFIDRHVFYAGRHISTELLTIQFEDYARPRLMTPEERQQLLEVVFAASGW